MSITDNYKRLRKEINAINPDVTIVVAAKTRSKEEIIEAINAGATHIGYNYVQEAEEMKKQLPLEIAKKVKWHLIGHLQKNKVAKALNVFDVIQTVDSYGLACEINKRAKSIMPVCIEVNIASEEQKSGAMPEKVEELIRQISSLNKIKVQGLMTMGPVADPEDLRLYFRKAKELMDHINSLSLSNATIEVLSMGMSDSYKVAIEEGSNMIRIGTALFGKRQ